MSISLTKGQRISLTKEAGGGLARVMMGLGWDPVKKPSGIAGLFGGGGRNIDLDASCVLLSGGKVVDIVWYRKLRSDDGSVVHTGDNLTGEGEGDDERILVDLAALPDKVDTLTFVINSYRGQCFDAVENAFCRVVDMDSGRELVRYDLSEKGPHTGLILCRLYRHGDDWKIQAVGEPANGRTVKDVLPLVQRL